MAEMQSVFRSGKLLKTLTHTVVTPLVGSTLAVVYALGRWDVRALVTGVVITAALALVWELDRRLVYPRLKGISQDWLRIESETFIGISEHLLAAVLALAACGWVLGFRVEPTTSWMLLIGIVLIFPILHGAEQIVDYNRQLREKERQEQELRTLAAEAELRALKAQINPHWLFNTLNTIAALIHSDPDLAEASVERLAEIFRHTLTSSERGQVPLAEELASVDDYLAIERARFGDRLKVSRETDPSVERTAVPSLILQPLVENAITHGCGEDGSIDLDIRVGPLGDQVVIAVADRGPGMRPGHAIGDDPGHGLRNVDERLRRLYGCGLELRDNTPRGTVAVVRIPREDKQDAGPHR